MDDRVVATRREPTQIADAIEVSAADTNRAIRATEAAACKMCGKLINLKLKLKMCEMWDGTKNKEHFCANWR